MRQAHQQRRRVALANDGRALAGAAARRLAALDQQDLRAGFPQMIRARGSADASADDDEVIRHKGTRKLRRALEAGGIFSLGKHRGVVCVTVSTWIAATPVRLAFSAELRFSLCA